VPSERWGNAETGKGDPSTTIQKALQSASPIQNNYLWKGESGDRDSWGGGGGVSKTAGKGPYRSHQTQKRCTPFQPAQDWGRGF